MSAPLNRASTTALLVGPSLLLALVIMGYPLALIVSQSMHDVSRFGVLRGFVGWDNYARVFADPVFVQVALRTLLWTVAVVAGAVAISLPVAVVLQQDFHARPLARTLVMLPWAVSLTMTAVVWRWAFNDQYGMVNASLHALGAIDGPLVWLADGAVAFWVEVGVGILVSVPFTVTIFLGGLSAIGQDMYEAAALEGASGWQQFARLTLPQMRPFIGMAVVLNMIYVFNSFPIIWIMTQGGPNNATHILVTYLYELGFRLGRPAEAAAISVLMLLMLLALTALYLRMQSRQAKGGGA